MNELIVALDVPALASARQLAQQVAAHAGAVKIGSQLYTAAGPAAVEQAQQAGARVFLDLKWHDIPNTVAAACREAARLGVLMLNVHAAGGARMIGAAREALEQATAAGSARPLLLAVTVLTSLDDDDLPSVGVRDRVAAQVERLAALARDAGADGLVASGHEVAALRAQWPAATLVIPGVRPVWSQQATATATATATAGDGAGGGAPRRAAAAGTAAAANGASAEDQRRVSTPAEVVRAGANYIVVGRPIVQAADPADAARRTAAEIEQS